MKSNAERIRFLKTVPLFAGVEEGELASLAKAMQERTFSAESLIFNEHDHGELLYIVVKGSVRIVKHSKTPVILAILNPTDFFGEMALFDREGRSASVEAQKDVALLALDGESFRGLISTHPGIGMAIIRTLAGRVREMQQEVLAARGLTEFFLERDADKKKGQRPG